MKIRIKRLEIITYPFAKRIKWGKFYSQGYKTRYMQGWQILIGSIVFRWYR